MSDWYAFDIHGAATMRVEKSAPTSGLLHDMFELPFEEIAPMVGRTPATTRQ